MFDFCCFALVCWGVVGGWGVACIIARMSICVVEGFIEV